MTIHNNQKLILIDGNAILHRAFYAIPSFKTSSGELVNAVYGFASMLLKILNEQNPDYIVIAFDVKEKTFRHKEYQDYKALRVKAPDELYAQIDPIKKLIKVFRIPIFECPGYEADDIIGTLAHQGDKKNINTYIVTGDLDALQLITEKTKVLALTQKFSQPVIYDTQKVIARYGLTPSQIIDMKALQGDSSDNIKGVLGIGAKTAKNLLQKYENLENIYANLDEISSENIKNKLIQGKEDAFFSRKLATIIKDMEIELNLEECKTHEYDEEQLREIFIELEFKSLLRRLDFFNKNSDSKRLEEKENNKNIQASLF